MSDMDTVQSQGGMKNAVQFVSSIHRAPSTADKLDQLFKKLHKALKK